MKTNEIKANAIEIVKVANSCKEVEKAYKGLIEKGIDKDTAKLIVKEAKGLINQSKLNQKNDRAESKQWFKVADNIAKPVFFSYLNENRRLLGNSPVFAYKNDLGEFVRKYWPNVDANGNPCKKVKKVWITFEITTSNFRGVLAKCFDSAIKERYANFSQNVVSMENE